jgi:hypothetical protein
MPTIKECREALREWRERLLALPGVVAVGIGYREKGGVKTDELCITVSVKEKLPAAELPRVALVPRVLDVAVQTDVRQTGEIQALGLTTRERPCPAGYSVGHWQITAGTLGVWVKRGAAAGLYILSNNHVLANSNEAAIGDRIWQPGHADGGGEADLIARLSEYVRINFIGRVGNGKKKPPSSAFWRAAKWFPNHVAKLARCPYRLVVRADGVIEQPTPNLVDAAIALVAAPEFALERIGPELLAVEGVRDLGLGERVHKWGRTTTHTSGYVDQIALTSSVSYGKGVAMFEDQVGIKADSGEFSAGGDSGSAILTEDNYLGGLLFAGGSDLTIANKMSHVISFLGVRV